MDQEIDKQHNEPISPDGLVDILEDLLSPVTSTPNSEEPKKEIEKGYSGYVVFLTGGFISIWATIMPIIASTATIRKNG
jgi:hypothetical protein